MSARQIRNVLVSPEQVLLFLFPENIYHEFLGHYDMEVTELYCHIGFVEFLQVAVDYKIFDATNLYQASSLLAQIKIGKVSRDQFMGYYRFYLNTLLTASMKLKLVPMTRNVTIIPRSNIDPDLFMSKVEIREFNEELSKTVRLNPDVDFYSVISSMPSALLSKDVIREDIFDASKNILSPAVKTIYRAVVSDEYFMFS